MENTKFYKYLEKLFKENNKKFNSTWDVSHNNDIPFDSFDRIYALYLLDTNSKLVETDISDVSKLSQDLFDKLLSEEEKEEFENVTNLAYENYEREGLAPYEAFYNLISVAKKGRDVVLTDSYYDGGWFGAS